MEKITNVEAEVKRLQNEVTELTEKNTNVEADRKTKTEELMNTLAKFTDIESHYINQAKTADADVKKLEKEIYKLNEKYAKVEADLNTKTVELKNSLAQFPNENKNKSGFIKQQADTDAEVRKLEREIAKAVGAASQRW